MLTFSGLPEQRAHVAHAPGGAEVARVAQRRRHLGELKVPE